MMPAEMIERQRIIDTVKRVYESYGFVPLDTPAMEYTEALLGEYGEEGTKQIYRLESPEGEDIALRFDLTVSLARVVAQYQQDIPKPFKRYQVATCWRADKPDPGRFREFVQFDIDSVGCADVAADAEIVAAMCETLEALGIENYAIKIGSRKVLDSLTKWARIPPERSKAIIRVIDKLDKQGLDAVKLELGPGRVDESGDKIPGQGLESAQIAKIEEFLGLPKKLDGLKAAAKLFAGVPESEEGLQELERMDGLLRAFGAPEDKAYIDLALARGLDYYTGPVFEAYLTDAPRFGSVFGGGRYDGLVERFLGVKIPGTGTSIGPDRLLAALQHLGLAQARPSTADVLVAVMVKDRMADYIQMARELRESGLRTELYLGTQKRIPKQLGYADKKDIPVAVIVGPDEFEKREVSIKDLVVGRMKAEGIEERADWLAERPGQVTVLRSEMVAKVKEILASHSEGNA